MAQNYDIDQLLAERDEWKQLSLDSVRRENQWRDWAESLVPSIDEPKSLSSDQLREYLFDTEEQRRLRLEGARALRRVLKQLMPQVEPPQTTVDMVNRLESYIAGMLERHAKVLDALADIAQGIAPAQSLAGSRVLEFLKMISVILEPSVLSKQ